MSYSELYGVLFTLLMMLGLSVPLGAYLARVFTGSSRFLNRLLDPFDRLIYRLGGVDAEQPMRWQEHLKALLGINLLWFVIALLILTNMGWLPLNPDGNPSMSADLAFNTAVSFITNTNLQHYSGESGLSYLGQMSLMLWQFISAGCGMAICAMVFLSMREKSGTPGNFYYLFVRSCTRVLLPLSLVSALFLMFRGVPMGFEGKATQVTLEGDTVQVSRGPAAGFVAIKQLGTNGGGFFGVNSAHPLENPDYATNILENLLIGLLPLAMVFAMGRILQRRRLAAMIAGVMLLGYLLLLLPTIVMETAGNPALTALGIDASAGSLEGKEIRLGSAASALWAITTTCTSNGSVNAMHDSMTPLSGMNALLGMMTNCFMGGIGVGFLNFYVFIILAVFISGLMVGRTPEFLGKKIEAREMKIAMLVALLHPLLILAGTAIATWMYSTDPAAYSGWLANPGYHGFSEMLYEFTSSSANNGSGFEGLGDNNPFWNIACGLVMLLARYLPIIGPVAIAGILSEKKYIPESAGTLRADTATFGGMVFAVIFIIAALSFFPVLALGPIAEFFSI
jgi:potassium-transporting ATPase potassium-binding subunit